MTKLATKLKAGDFVVNTWGATMRRAEYYEVLVVNGSKVILGTALTSFEANGYDSGRLTLVGRDSASQPVKRAKLTAKGLKLCREKCIGQKDGVDIFDNWSVGRHHWDYLTKVEIGASEYTYGD